jgi:hypothetical protein
VRGMPRKQISPFPRSRMDEGRPETVARQNPTLIFNSGFPGNVAGLVAMRQASNVPPPRSSGWGRRGDGEMSRLCLDIVVPGQNRH